MLTANEGHQGVSVTRDSRQENKGKKMGNLLKKIKVIFPNINIVIRETLISANMDEHQKTLSLTCRTN